jgi:hypothetical protein
MLEVPDGGLVPVMPVEPVELPDCASSPLAAAILLESPPCVEAQPVIAAARMKTRDDAAGSLVRDAMARATI